jgi:hypothetical protein
MPPNPVRWSHVREEAYAVGRARALAETAFVNDAKNVNAFTWIVYERKEQCRCGVL